MRVNELPTIPASIDCGRASSATNTIYLQVQKGGPADIAGLKEDDILIEVNGVNVENEDYEKVVARIREGSNMLTLLVREEKAHQHFMSENPNAAAASVTTPPHNYSNDPPPYTEVQVPQRLLSEAHETVSLITLLIETERKCIALAIATDLVKVTIRSIFSST